MARWLTLTLIVLALGTAARPAIGQAQQPDGGDRLVAVALTEADLPAGLTLDQRRTGVRSSGEGTPSYLATFVGNGAGDPPIMGIVNVVSASADGAAGIEQLTDRFRTGLGGTPTEVAAPGIGEASRAFTVTTQAMGGAITASTAFVALRRADVVAGVAVTSLGATPQTDVALRLAQQVDRRVATTPRPGA
jgi:hypothetical protein